jgi:preprotein translocase subunit SecD
MQATPRERFEMAKEDEAMDAAQPVSASPDAATLRNISRRLKEAANNPDPDFDLAGEAAKVSKSLKDSDHEGLNQVAEVLDGHIKKGRKALKARKAEKAKEDEDVSDFDFNGHITRVAQRLEQMSNEALAAQQAASIARPVTSRVREYGTTDPM